MKDKGLEFSDPPTEKEIENAKKTHEMKKELEGIDTSLIIEGSRRRESDGNQPGSAEKKVKIEKTSDASGTVKSPMEKLKATKKHNLDADEEADF